MLDYYIKTYVGLFAIIFFLSFILRYFYCKIRKTKFVLLWELSFSFFVFSIISLLILVSKSEEQSVLAGETVNFIYRLKSGYRINLVPFETTSFFFNFHNRDYFFINVIGNIILFLPIGIFLPALWKFWRSWKKMILFSFLFPLLIEISQLFSNRFVDVDDIILNAFGIMLGYGIYVLLKKIRIIFSSKFRINL